MKSNLALSPKETWLIFTCLLSGLCIGTYFPEINAHNYKAERLLHTILHGCRVTYSEPSNDMRSVFQAYHCTEGDIGLDGEFVFSIRPNGHQYAQALGQEEGDRGIATILDASSYSWCRQDNYLRATGIQGADVALLYAAGQLAQPYTFDSTPYPPCANIPHQTKETTPK